MNYNSLMSSKSDIRHNVLEINSFANQDGQWCVADFLLTSLKPIQQNHQLKPAKHLLHHNCSYRRQFVEQNLITDSMCPQELISYGSPKQKINFITVVWKTISLEYGTFLILSKIPPYIFFSYLIIKSRYSNIVCSIKKKLQRALKLENNCLLNCF